MGFIILLMIDRILQHLYNQDYRQILSIMSTGKNKKFKRSVTINMRCPENWLNSVEKFAEQKNKSLSETIRSTSSIGMKVLNYQDMMKKPDQSAEFQQKMKEIMTDVKSKEWAATLTSQELEGFLLCLQLEKEGRYKVEAFR